MKKIILFSLMLCLVNSVFAQILPANPTDAVGIGTLPAAPYKLHIKSDGNTLTLIESPNATGIQFSGGSTRAGINTINDGSLRLYSNTLPSGHDVSQSQFVIRNGLVGIGTATPEWELDIYGRAAIRNGQPLRFYSTIPNDEKLNISSGTANSFITAPTGGLILTSSQMGIALDVAQDVVFRNFNNTGVTDVVRVQTTTGKVLIGNNTTNIASNDYRLFVQTGILTERVRVAVRNSGDWADYVFDKTYKLPTLKSVESFISKNKHLPDVPSAATVQAEGIDLAKMDAVLLKKIEELTLYMIDLNKSVQTLKAENQALKAQIKSIQK